MPRATLAEYIEDLRRHGPQTAYVHRRGYRRERWTYAEIYERATGFRGELRERGIEKGDRVLLWGENCAEWVAAFFGCVLGGAVVVPIDDGALAEFALRVRQQVQAKLVVCSRKHCAQFEEDGRAVLEELGKAPRPGARGMVERCEIEASDPLQIVFTSGTTAEPSGVVITHGNVVANVGPLENEIRKYLKYERWVHPIRFLNLLPLSHVFGQFLALYLPPLMAGTVIFQDTLNPREVVETIRRERVSVLVAVPRMLQSLKERVIVEVGVTEEALQRQMSAAQRRHYLHRWWMFRRFHRALGWKFWALISGGAALDEETEEFWRRLGFAVVQGYGLTETTSLISVNHPFRVGKGSIGKVLEGREVKLAEDGEILVRGAGVARARWSEAGMTPIAEDDGWYRTGDLGALDADGNLYFKGRKKETIVSPAGMNIYPADLEAALRAQPEVRDCVVVGVPRGGNAEPCAVLLLRSGLQDGEGVVRRANIRLAEYQQIRLWHVWPDEDFPRTPTQKPRRVAIDRAVRDHFASAVGTGAGGGIDELIERIAGEPNPAGPAGMGLSSLERVELLSALEDRYQVDLSEARFAAANNTGDIQRLLQEARGGVAYHYPRWALRWPVTWIRAAAFHLLVHPAVALLGSPKVVGRENLKDVQGPVLVVSNHIDDVDVGFIQTALPARLRSRLATAAGGEALEALRVPPANRGMFGSTWDRMEWALGVALLNLFPLPKEAGFRRSFAYAGEAVDRGYSILVFPEGRHTTDGKMNPFRTGVGLLTNNLGIPVVPMRIDGLFEIKRAGKRFAPPGRIQVRIGKPVQFEAGTKAEEIAARLQQCVQQL